MNGEKIKFNDLYEYEVETIKEGGMGRVLILNRTPSSHTSEDLIEAIMHQPNMADKYGFVYREKLAAKTFKDKELVVQNKALFERELRIWLNLDTANVAKLLHVTFVDKRLFALMPFYNSNLREIITSEKGCVGIHNAKFIIINIIHGLYEVFKKFKLVHQDIKPENILVDFGKDRNSFFVSDWGIANLQKTICPISLSRHSLDAYADTMTGMGTLPYMSPERFIDYSTHITVDIFSVGMIFFELLFGHLPYVSDFRKTIVSQIVSQEYFHTAECLLKKNFDEKVTSVILKCIHPDMTKRYNNYEDLVFDVYNC
jgi:serine/threonine protein kinase